MSIKKEYKIVEKQCKNCGEMYDSNYKRCPHCGYDPLKNTLKTLTIIICLLLLISNLIVSLSLYKKVNELESQLNGSYTASDLEEYSEDLGINITEQSYYATYALTDDEYEDTLAALDSYILYFHQEDCSHCEEANYFINEYINLGYAGYLPVLFIDLATGEELFEKYGVDTTPTAILVNEEEIINTYYGAEDIWTLFDEIVAAASE